MGKELVDHPEHYNNNPSGIECIDVIEHMNFNLGSAMKYLWRVDDKGNDIEDLRKAVWYIEREIKRREASSDQKRLQALQHNYSPECDERIKSGCVVPVW